MAKKTSTSTKTVTTRAPKDHSELWSVIGPKLTDRTVVKELGAPVYVTDRHNWVFAEIGGEVVGFTAVLSPDKDGVSWIDAAWVSPESRKSGAWAAMFDASMASAAKSGAKRVRACTCNPVITEALKRRGFAEYSRKGSWSYAEKSL